MALDHRRLVACGELVVDSLVEFFEVRFAKVVSVARHIDDGAGLERLDPRFTQVVGFQNLRMLVFHGSKFTRLAAKEGMTMTCPLSVISGYICTEVYTMDKTFWQEALKQFGVGIVFAVMLAIFYTNENAKWEKNAANDQVRWEAVLKQYSDDLSDQVRRIPSVANVKMFGEQKEQISLYVDRQRLQAYAYRTGSPKTIGKKPAPKSAAAKRTFTRNSSAWAK